MKKNLKTLLSIREKIGKTTQILVLLICMMVVSTHSWGFVAMQGGKISINEKSISLEDLIWKLKQETGYKFIYNSSHLTEYDKLEVKAEGELVEVLNEVLKETDLTYSIKNGAYVIKKRDSIEIKQQQKVNYKISGKVTDEKGVPLPGVTVKIEGTYVGTATDIDGNFLFSSPKSEGALVISFVGKKTQKIAFEAGKQILVKLEEDTSNLDEVTITAYGTTTKREMTGSITTVKGEDLADIPVSNVATALQGRVAGLDIQNVSGAPGGGGVSTAIRGYGSMNSEQGRGFSSPLWVIDGIPVSNMSGEMTGTSAIAEIDPAMIESVEVLKDASASALYGSRAANGVILVTTKQGRKGKTQISSKVSYSYSFLPKFPDVTAGRDARNHKLEGFRSSSSAGTDVEANEIYHPRSHYEAWKMAQKGVDGGAYDGFWVDGGAYTLPPTRVLQDSLNSFYNNQSNWFDLFFKSGKVVDANIQARGGNDKVLYSFGGGYYSEEGILENSGFNRASIISSLNFKPSNKTTFDFRVFASLSGRKKTGFSNTEQLPNAPYELSPFYPGAGSIVAKTSLAGVEDVKQKNEDFRLRANLSISHDITDDLNFKTMNSIDYAVSKYNYFMPSYITYSRMSISQGGMGDYTNALSENILNYKKSINELHNFDVMAGFTYQKDTQTSYKGSGQDSPSDLIYYVRPGFPVYEDKGDYIEKRMLFESDFTESILVSLIGRFKYNYNKKYMFEASIRRDGSSKFGKAVPWGTFPAFSAGWTFSEENFMDFLPQLDFGKLRSSWGVSGNQFQAPYLAYGVLNPGNYTFRGGSTMAPDDQGGLVNPELTWEETEQFNVGLDLDLFDYRLGIVFDYYNKYTDGLLYSIPFPGNYNFYRFQWRNAAAISNTGMELALKFDVFRGDDFSWKINFNIARNWNRFEKSYDGRDISRQYTLGKPVNGIYALESNGIYDYAEDVPHFYTPDGLKRYSNSGADFRRYKAGDNIFVDQNKDGQIDDEDLVYVGSPLPKAYGGILNDIKWKNFDISFLLSYSLGRSILNTTEGYAVQVTTANLDQPILTDLSEAKFWQNPGDSGVYPKVEVDTRQNITSSTNFLQKNVHYMKLKNIVIGYRLPKSLTSKLKISNAKIFMSGENLLTITNYKGLDPETIDITRGTDNGKYYPLVKKLTVGLSVNF